MNRKEATKILRGHFNETTPEDFNANVDKHCSEMTDPSFPFNSSCSGKTPMTQLKIFEPHPVTIPLDAYLASALTGLNVDERQLVFQLSDTLALIAKRHKIEVYEPRKSTDPVHHAEVSDSEVFRIDRERVLTSDLLIVLCHYPSFGAGEELDFAFSALVPTILIIHSDHSASRMVTGVPTLQIHLQYTEPEDLREEFERCLVETRPILEQRKLAYSGYDANIVGERIRLRREELGLTRRDVEEEVPHLRAEALKQLEEACDKIANPSLIQLREIATILKTTVADLVEPNSESHVLAHIQEWISGETAARGGSVFSNRDRNRIIRRLLLRILDSLEIEDVHGD